MLSKVTFLLVSLASIILATPIVTIQPESFTSSIYANVGSQTCTDPLTCDLAVGASSADVNISPPGTLNFTAIWGGPNYGGTPYPGVFVDATMTAGYQVTITGGTGTGIAVACVQGQAPWSMYLATGTSAWLNIGMNVSGTQEPSYDDAGCPLVELGMQGEPSLGIRYAAVDFTYGVPFTLTATTEANALAGPDGCQGCYGYQQITTSPQFSVLVLDPPDPPASVPEPSTLVPFLILGGYGLAQWLHRSKVVN